MNQHKVDRQKRKTLKTLAIGAVTTATSATALLSPKTSNAGCIHSTNIKTAVTISLATPPDTLQESRYARVTISNSDTRFVTLESIDQAVITIDATHYNIGQRIIQAPITIRPRSSVTYWVNPAKLKVALNTPDKRGNSELTLELVALEKESERVVATSRITGRFV